MRDVTVKMTLFSHEKKTEHFSIAQMNNSWEDKSPEQSFEKVCTFQNKACSNLRKACTIVYQKSKNCAQLLVFVGGVRNVRTWKVCTFHAYPGRRAWHLLYGILLRSLRCPLCRDLNVQADHKGGAALDALFQAPYHRGCQGWATGTLQGRRILCETCDWIF